MPVSQISSALRRPALNREGYHSALRSLAYINLPLALGCSSKPGKRG